MKNLGYQDDAIHAELVRIMVDADLQAESEKPTGTIATSHELLGR